MREIRQSGSEGGAAGVITGRPYPYLAHVPQRPSPSRSDGAPAHATQGASRTSPNLFASALR